MHLKKINVCLSLLLFFLCSLASFGQEKESKVGGVNVMPSWNEVMTDYTDGILEANADWVSLVTYRYGDFDNGYFPVLGYEAEKQKWGETTDGVKKMALAAKAANLKVMLKPSVWFPSYGWPGDFELTSEEDWQTWEALYKEYLMEMALLGDSVGVDLLCIGTEFKRAIQMRPQFWSGLIKDLRQVYKGQLTYAANWDNFEAIPFWDQLDYIGIDAYFPLSDLRTPQVEDLKQKWEKPKKQIERIQKKYNKPVLFTEFGYRSIDQCVWKQWELENIVGFFPANQEAQVNGYQAIFESFWEEDWFAGGFIWNWSAFDEVAGGPNDNDYTPQNKPCEALIREWYDRF